MPVGERPKAAGGPTSPPAPATASLAPPPALREQRGTRRPARGRVRAGSFINCCLCLFNEVWSGLQWRAAGTGSAPSRRAGAEAPVAAEGRRGEERPLPPPSPQPRRFPARPLPPLLTAGSRRGGAGCSQPPCPHGAGAAPPQQARFPGGHRATIPPPPTPPFRPGPYLRKVQAEAEPGLASPAAGAAPSARPRRSPRGRLPRGTGSSACPAHGGARTGLPRDVFLLLFLISCLSEAQINQPWVWRGPAGGSCLLTKRGGLGQLGHAPSQAAADLLWSSTGKTLIWFFFPFIYSLQPCPKPPGAQRKVPLCPMAHLGQHPSGGCSPPPIPAASQSTPRTFGVDSSSKALMNLQSRAKKGQVWGTVAARHR